MPGGAEREPLCGAVVSPPSRPSPRTRPFPTHVWGGWGVATVVGYSERGDAYGCIRYKRQCNAMVPPPPPGVWLSFPTVMRWWGMTKGEGGCCSAAVLVQPQAGEGEVGVDSTKFSTPSLSGNT